MGYIIKYPDIYVMYDNVKRYKEKLIVGFDTHIGSMQGFNSGEFLEGETSRAIDDYISDVHYRCKDAIIQGITELEMRLVFYAWGWNSVDADLGAVLNTDKMDYYNSLTQNVCENDMCDSVNEINSVINSVSDILPFDQLFQVGNYDNHLNDTMKGISDFKDKVINYENSCVGEFSNVIALLSGVANLINEYSNKDINSYQKNDVLKSPNYVAMMAAFESSRTYVAQNQSRFDDVKPKLDNIICRYNHTESFAKCLSEYGMGQVLNHYFSTDPVDLSTGNFVYKKTDIVLEGDYELRLERFYNALMNNRESVIGCGYTHNYNLRLSNYDEDAISITMADGHKLFFELTEDGVYDNIFSYDETLVKVSDEENKDYKYRLIDSDSIRYFFNEEGLLLRQEDSNHVGVTLKYDNDKLINVFNDGNEYIKFNYNDEGLISSIDTSKDRTIKYEYKDGYLVDVIMPNSNRYHYVYSTDNQIAEVLNGDEISQVKNTYDEKGRIIRQDFIDGSFMTYEYVNNKVVLTERNGQVTTYEHDENNNTSKVTYPDKSTEEFKYNDKGKKIWNKDRNGFVTKYEYNERGMLSKEINALGVASVISYDENNNIKRIQLDGKNRLEATYDSNSNLISRIDAEGNKRELTYDDCGHVTSITDEDGYKTIVEYDDNGNVISIIKPTGVKVGFSYDEYNRPVKTIDGNGNETSFTYDINDRITSIVNAKGDRASFEYNLIGKVIKSNDFDGESVEVAYNNLNLEESVIDKEGNITRFEYDKMWNITKTHLPSGAIIENVYDKNNRLTKVILPEGQSQSVEYDFNGNIIKETDANSSTTKYKYDVLNRLIGITNALGKVTRFKYDRLGNVIKEIDNNGNETSYEYDNNNRLIASTNKLGEKTTYEYYPSGKRRKIAFSDNTFEEYTYENGLLTRIRNRQGVVTKLSYDNNENIVSETNAAGDIIRYEYDKLDMLVKIITPEGGERRFLYDKVGNMTKLIDELGNVTSYEYTSNGKLSKVIDAKGNETSYKYDTVGNLIEVKRIGEFDEITSYEYDLNGNVTKVTDPLMNSDVYTYDGMGRVISKLDRDENFTNISYNSIGQVEKIIYSDDNEVKMSYDELGFLKEIEDLNGKIEIETDILGHVLTTTDYSGNRVLYEYENNKRKSMTYPDGKKLDYQYNDNGLLSSICLNDSRLVSYNYDKMARPLTKLMSNGQESDYTYNSIGRLSSVTHKLGDKIESLSYRYDLSGNKTEVVKHRFNETDNGTFTYGYDALNQLTSVSKDNNLLREYTYDAFGNRASKKSYKDTIEESIYTYNKNNQLIKEVMPSVTKIYDYDKRGNLTTITSNDVVTDRYEYGINNQLISSSIVKNNDRVTSSYSYNGLGQRIGEVINTPEDPEKKISYVLDITKQYNNMLTESKGERKANYYYDNGAIALDVEDNTSYYMQDDLGSILGLTDKDCNIIESYDYDEFGNEIELVSNPIQSLTYTGYRKELATNSLYAQARQYNPLHGRFMSEDIVKGDRMMPISLNSYVYCYNKPEDYVDVDGRTACNAGVTRVMDSYLDDASNSSTGTSGFYNGTYVTALGDSAKKYVYNGEGTIGTSGLALDVASEGLEQTISHSTPKVKATDLGKTISKFGGKSNIAFAAIGGGIDAYNEYNDIIVKDKNKTKAASYAAVEGGVSILSSMAIGAFVGSIIPGAGTVVGAVLGIIVGAALSIGFDYVINKEFVEGQGSMMDNLKELVYEDIVSPIKSRIDGGTCFMSEPV